MLLFLFTDEFILIIDTIIRIISIPNRIKEEPIVPKFNPPLSADIESRSPKVAPNGRVRTNTAQNKITLDISVK